VPDLYAQLGEVRPHFLGGCFAAQVVHNVTPLIEHRRQMNVKHSSHGYPSDARSALPHARQIIVSRS
jgi:hypothetical protein